MLNISKSRVKELPKDFGEPQSLEELYATRCSSLSRLPKPFGNLSNLKRKINKIKIMCRNGGPKY